MLQANKCDQDDLFTYLSFSLKELLFFNPAQWDLTPLGTLQKAF